MTADEMIRGVQLGVQKVDSFAFDSLIEGEIEYYLNKGQIAFVKERFEKAHQNEQKFFESNVRVTEELRPLVTPDKLIDAYYGGDNAAVDGFDVDVIDFEPDHLYLLNHRSVIEVLGSDAEVETDASTPAQRVVSSGTSVTRVVSNRFSQQDDIYRLLDDPFNKTRPQSPIVTIGDTGMSIYTDDKFIVDQARITYLRTPKKIVSSSQNSELPEGTHDDIVDLTVSMILEDFKSGRPSKPIQEPLEN